VVDFSSDGSLFHVDGPATAKLRGLKPTVLVLCTSRLSLSANHEYKRVGAADTRRVISARYGDAFVDELTNLSLLVDAPRHFSVRKIIAYTVYTEILKSILNKYT